jgi:hypothetical protein
MDLKSGCAFEAGLEPQTQERGCYETRCLKKFGKIKAFSTKTKTKEIFKGGSIKKIAIIPPTQKYLIIIQDTRKANNNYQYNSQPWNTIFKKTSHNHKTPSPKTKTKKKANHEKALHIQRVY